MVSRFAQKLQAMGDPHARLMLVTARHRTGGRDLVDVVHAAFAGGLRIVQIREKDLDDASLTQLTEKILQVAPADALVLINDRPSVAKHFDIGLHCPEMNHETAAANFSGPCGRSAHSIEAARAFAAQGVDYVVLGTLFPTVSKPLEASQGLALLEGVQALPIPVYAIGGLSAANAAQVLEHGAYGIATCGAILESDDPKSSTQDLLQVIARVCDLKKCHSY